MKNKLLTICAYIIGFIFAAMLPIMLISYLTYTEKIVMPILLVIMLICSMPIVIDYLKNK